MMMDITYSSKRTITTADLFNMADPPLIFEVRVRPGAAWALLFSDFETTGANDVEVARALIAMSFLTVRQEGEKYPLDHVDHVQALQDAVERTDPGNGETFICDLAWGFGRNYYRYIGDHLGNSLKPLEQSNGTAESKTPVKAS